MCKIKPKTLLFFILYIVLFEGILINVLHIPGIIMYMADFLLFFLIIYSFIKNKKLEKEERIIKNIMTGLKVLILKVLFQN